MNKPTPQELVSMQTQDVKKTLIDIYRYYSTLVYDKIIEDKLSTSSSVIYNLVDILLPLNALLIEANKEKVFSPYVLSKLEMIKSQVDSACNYFKEDSNE